jgi:transposase-like protein
MDVAAARLLYDNGIGPSDIAKRLGIGPASVYRALSVELRASD